VTIPYHTICIKVGAGTRGSEVGPGPNTLSPSPQDLRHHTIFQVSAFRAHKTLRPRYLLLGELSHMRPVTPFLGGMPTGKHTLQAVGRERE
jgi:hypothetical protein